MAKNEASSQASEEKVEQSAPQGGATKQIILAGVVLMGLVVGSAGAAVFAASLLIKPVADPAAALIEQETASGTEDEAGATAEEYEQFSFGQDTDGDIVTNVAETSGRRYLCTHPVFTVQSGVLNEESKRLKLKSFIIALLSDKTMESLTAQGAMRDVCREIVEQANADPTLELNGAIKSVDMEKWVIQ
jgi:flagellar basal body-associated protein FliL